MRILLSLLALALRSTLVVLLVATVAGRAAAALPKVSGEGAVVKTATAAAGEPALVVESGGKLRVVVTGAPSPPRPVGLVPRAATLLRTRSHRIFSTLARRSRGASTSAAPRLRRKIPRLRSGDPPWSRDVR